MSLSIYDLVPLGFEVLEVPEFEEEDEDKEANKDLVELGISLTVYVDETFVVHIMKETKKFGSTFTKAYNFSSVSELKDWMENVLPNLELEFIY